MKEIPDISRIASLIGDPARSNMLNALMSGKALTATELAKEANVTNQTASSHLKRLLEGGLIYVNNQGRHRYFSLANSDVASVLESLTGLASGVGHLRTRTGPKDAELRHARVCYNHLAGEMGIQMYDSLISHGRITDTQDEVMITQEGERFVKVLGVNLDALLIKKSPLCKACLDWSERRTHLGGNLGRALFTQFEQIGWLTRLSGTRIIRFTDYGKAAFNSTFPTK